MKETTSEKPLPLDRLWFLTGKRLKFPTINLVDTMFAIKNAGLPPKLIKSIGSKISVAFLAFVFYNRHKITANPIKTYFTQVDCSKMIQYFLEEFVDLHKARVVKLWNNLKKFFFVIPIKFTFLSFLQMPCLFCCFYLSDNIMYS